jgi:phosphoglucomutase
VDEVARQLHVPLYETPVGFKYNGALMESEAIIVGGEESGGLSVKGTFRKRTEIWRAC